MNGELLRQLGMLLRVLRLKAGVDQGLLAARLGVSQPTVSRYESGLSQIREEQARLWIALCREALPAAQRGQADEVARALGVLFQEAAAQDRGQAALLLRQAEYALVLEAEPLPLGKPSGMAGTAATAEPVTLSGVPAHLLARDPGCYTLRVIGDSMAPLLVDGDFVVASPALALTNGCLVAARLEPGGPAIRLYHELPGGIVVLQPANPTVPPTVLTAAESRGLARVVFLQREL